MGISPLRVSAAVLTLALLAALLRPEPAVAQARVTRADPIITVTNGLLTVRYDLSRGLADYAWGQRTVLRNAYASATVGSGPGRQRTTFEAGRRTATTERFSDGLGTGLRLHVRTELPRDDVALTQQLDVYDSAAHLTARVSVERVAAGGAPLEVGQIEVLAASAASDPAGGLSLGGMQDDRFYQVPFYNNDDFVMIPRRQARGALSYWLGGVVDATGGAGFITGAVETTVWKSAVWYDGPTNAISAHSGTRSPADTIDPPPRRGQRVDSALTFAGYGANHQDVLAAMMNVIAHLEAPLPAPHLPAPIGWSAWYQQGLNADEATVRGVADFIADNWAELGYRYINLDAGWNRADGDTRYDPTKFPGGIERLVAHIHRRGLLAGGYFVPFAISPTLLDQSAPGTPYSYRDLILRDAGGTPVRPSILDWEYVLDLTHPGAPALLYTNARRLADYGFDFVKLDFLHIGTQEGARYDPNLTAMEGFHRGMRAITDAWEHANRPIFLSAAISPLYLQQYVHARRTGNDVEFGQARQAKNVALSWFTGLLYHRNDPDNAVVRRGWFPGYNDALAKLHVTMDALGGTLFIAGDDPRELSPARAALLTNRDVLALARRPLVIQPLSVGDEPPSVWHGVEENGTRLLGIFNWNGTASARHEIRLSDLGLDPRERYRVYDLWEQRDIGMREFSITVELAPHGVALLRIAR